MTEFASNKDQALTSDELDRVAGGIIIVGGHQQKFSFTSVLDPGRAQSAAAAAEDFFLPPPLIAAFAARYGKNLE